MQLQVALTAEMKNKANVRSQNLAMFPFFALFSLLSKAQGASETRIRLPKTKMTSDGAVYLEVAQDLVGDGPDADSCPASLL